MMRARGHEPCIEEFAQYVVKKISDLELETPLYIAGHSMGGGVALRIAYDRPELVNGLVLINSIGTRGDQRLARGLQHAQAAQLARDAHPGRS
jgi:pimeloyl-ACP methyl ester carboxylesterase